MNEVLKINYETEQPTVSARDLHEALGVASRFSHFVFVLTSGFVGSDQTLQLVIYKL